MITITQFNQICLDIKAAVPGISEHILAVHEDQATKKLDSKAGVIFLAIIPSADRHGRPNSAMNINSTIFFILEKGSTGTTDAKELEQYQKLQNIILGIQNFMEEKNAEGLPIYSRYEPSKSSIDPEHFSGFNGWSMALEF